MPQGFDECVKNKGRVRTKSLPGGKYMHICFLHGKSYAGEIKTKHEGSPGRALMTHSKGAKAK